MQALVKNYKLALTTEKSEASLITFINNLHKNWAWAVSNTSEYYNEQFGLITGITWTNQAPFKLLWKTVNYWTALQEGRQNQLTTIDVRGFLIYQQTNTSPQDISFFIAYICSYQTIERL
jgi:hypothetical protein